MTIKYRYVRHPLKHDKLIGCVATDENGKIGWSQCHPKDTFHKQAARGIAERRLHDPDGKKPACYKLYNPDGTTLRINPIQGAMNALS